MSGLLVSPRIFAAIAVLATFGGSPALACNPVGIAHLGSANADRVVILFQNRRPALEIKDQARISAVAGYFMDLGGAWRSTMVTPSALSGDIYFYRADQIVESVWVSPTALDRGGCNRDLKHEELSALVSLLDIKPADLEK